MKINLLNNCIFQSKMPKTIGSRVKIVGEIDGYVEHMLNESNSLINTVANANDAFVKIAQKGERVFINSGAITSSFSKKDIVYASDVERNVIRNIIANSEVRTGKGLDKGFSRIV